MRRVLLAMLALVAAYGALVIWLPEATVSPGDMIAGHEPLASDCFRCHSAFRGTPSQKCVACHALATIGLELTSGAPITSARGRPPFHQALLDASCVACHSDHLGTGRPGANAIFTHELLRQDVVASCGDCHGDRVPQDDIHRSAPETCGTCHGFAAWTPATFDHAVLSAGQRKACVACHLRNRPNDGLHRQAGDDCVACHGTQAWKPATFEHGKYFRFDRHHPGDPCQSCHPDTLERYTCYGCHEHTPPGIAREHREEGITDFADCVRCHRSGDEHEAERGHSRGGRSREHD
jgi:hypothetical protein